MFVTATGCAARPFAIDRVLPFAGEDQVRVVTEIHSPAKLTAIDVHAEIVGASNKQLLWRGALSPQRLTIASGDSQSEYFIKGLTPKLWTPATPNLYWLTVTVSQSGKVLDQKTVRIGFRSFAARDGQFWLNGKPIFLRGLAINPPGRGISKDVGESKQFALDYVRALRANNFNCIRMYTDSQEWFDACDELGMLVYQGVYGAPKGSHGGEEDYKGKGAPPPDFESSIAEYKRIFETYVPHPSIVIYILSNELPYTGERGKAWHDYLTKAHEELKKWDNSRPYIGNAGYGEGREGDINDVHRYWGWYYNSFLTYYNIRDPKIFGDPEKNQPFTFSECVGSFTGSSGQFNLTFKKQLGAQLHWTGHAPNQKDEAEWYQSFMMGRACESFRTMRENNPRISGLMPFTILFYNWRGISSFQEMGAKPVLAQTRLSYQSVLLSWELWTPQVYAGTKIKPTAHIVNDSEDCSALTGATLEYSVRDPHGKPVVSANIKLPEIPYYAASRHPLEIELPKTMPTGEYTVTGRILRGNDQLSTNQTLVFVAGSDWSTNLHRPEKQLKLYDPTGRTLAALKQLSLDADIVTDVTSIKPPDVLIIGEQSADDALQKSSSSLRDFVRAGGRILCLGQNPDRFDSSWLPAKIEMYSASANSPQYPTKHRPTADQMAINPERPWHPVLENISRRRLFLWSDYTQWDQHKDGFPHVYPVTHGFGLVNPDDLAHVAIIANYDRGLQGIAACEMFDGKGSVILSSFDLVPRIGLDPIADRMLRNLVTHAASTDTHELHPRVDQTIVWGDYPTERGVFSMPLQGLVYNCRWIPTKTNGHLDPLPDNEGAWNSKPGDQYIAVGVRPFGPYTYTPGTGPRELDKSPIGSGFFWASIPSNKTRVITKVQNESDSNATLRVQVNDTPPTETKVKSGSTIDIPTKLPAARNPQDIMIRYTGDKTLVILETRFE